MGVRRRTRGEIGVLVAVAWLVPLLAAPAPVWGDAVWRAEIFSNPNLAGAPALIRTDPAIDFDWGQGSPAPGIPPDQFSIRWTGSISLEPGTYRFATLTDDGVRLYVDGHLVIDQWRETAPAISLAYLDLSAGFHQVRMEYYEAQGGAVARLSWSRLADPSRPVTAWRGEYYRTPLPWGTPALVREDAKIDFNWGKGSPDPQIPVDGFSGRWMRDVYFDAGIYRFTTETDDGVRLYVDEQPLVDQWRDMAPTAFSAEVNLAQGVHVVRMEYYDALGDAMARLSWVKLPPPGQPVAAWRGEYWDNPVLWGNPVLVRDDPQIAFDWGLGSPDPRIPVDGFSARWTREVEFRSGRYEFTTETDDGVRLFLDDRLILDAWQDMSGSLSVRVWVDAGKRTVRMEYYERTGGAKARLFWRGASDTMAVGNLITCVGLRDSWIKVYQRMADGSWQDMRPEGWGAMDVTGHLKIDGLPVDTLLYGDQGHPYRVELWSQGRLVRSVGHTEAGQPPFVIHAGVDNATPWQCPAL